MFKLYFLTSVVIFFNLKIKTRVQILKNNIKNWFYKGIGALVP
jgi:hypothetical protein